MSPRRPAHTVAAFLRNEWTAFTTIRPSDRPWQLPFAAAVASGVPLALGAMFERMDLGLVGSLGGLVFLYLPATALQHRMAMVGACAAAMTLCFAIGLLTRVMPGSAVPAATVLSIGVTMGCRYFGVGPPGALFFVMAAAIAAHTPIGVGSAALPHVPLLVGVMGASTLFSCAVGLAYSLWTLRKRTPLPTPALPATPPETSAFDYVVVDSVIIGLSVGVAILLAQLLKLEKPYWVPVACLAVIQQATFRTTWHRQVHRILGTALGLLVAWSLFLLPLNAWGITAMVTVLMFVIETVVVRHYAFAVTFITPMSLLLAEAAAMQHASPTELMKARLLDTVLGCAVGLVGGACLHSRWLRGWMGKVMRRFVPPRLLKNC